MLREIADQEKNKNLRFKIVEKGGMTIGRSFMRPNPIGSDQCGKEDCLPCKSGSKNCHKNDVCYEFNCKTCKAMEVNANYYGESCRNLYTRAGEHVKKSEKGDVNSFINKHQMEFHNSEPPNFTSKVIKSFKDPLSRQVTEAILIKNHRGGPLLNSKSEFYQPSIVQVRQEVVRGLERV